MPMNRARPACRPPCALHCHQVLITEGDPHSLDFVEGYELLDFSHNHGVGGLIKHPKLELKVSPNTLCVVLKILALAEHALLLP